MEILGIHFCKGHAVFHEAMFFSPGQQGGQRQLLWFIDSEVPSSTGISPHGLWLHLLYAIVFQLFPTDYLVVNFGHKSCYYSLL